MRSNPTGRQLRLGAELRKLRERAGLSSTQASRLLGVQQNQISNVEAARAGVSPERVRTLACHYDCGEKALVEALGDMAAERTRGWWEEYRELLPAALLDLAEVEHHAERLRAAVTLHIPGLLQTRDYAREVFGQDVPVMSPPDVEHRVSFRVKRQAVLYRDSPTPHQAIVHEAALRMRLGGPDVTRSQLQHLLDMGELDHITVRVLTFGAGILPGSGQSFYYSTGPVPQLDTVHLDQSHGPVFLDSEAQLHKYRVLLDRMEASALPSNESRDLIRRIAQEL
ncbi:helix-turn-helix transcriptional regulator [Streptomyces sp. AC512_CC834]|uniref:helix-turn-helix domain-containing protein n=1 Tax=Streptomyces sp. AC512_CC834 TaxID=2823691 RepID=UPI001C2665D6|nr:helix-turn-helix transcriptional regulator [Streptomyces sp. AC512_CC834]